MADPAKSTESIQVTDLVRALDEALDNIAGAHRMLEGVRKVEQDRASPETQALRREVQRAWSAIDIAGALTTRLQMEYKARLGND